MNIAYIMLCAKDRQIPCSPNCFSPKEIKLAKENDVAIESNQYGHDLITANACPHCGKLFGNNHIKELAGTKYKKIENVQEICKENIVIIK